MQMCPLKAVLRRARLFIYLYTYVFIISFVNSGSASCRELGEQMKGMSGIPGIRSWQRCPQSIQDALSWTVSVKGHFIMIICISVSISCSISIIACPACIPVSPPMHAGIGSSPPNPEQLVQ